MVLRYRINRLSTLRSQLLLIPACVAFAFNTATANDIDLPLLKQAKALQCAQTQPAAKDALGKFWDIQTNDLLASVGEKPGATPVALHAGTFDIILNTLVNTAERYPELRNQVERTMLQWNYCDIFNDGVFYDLKLEGGLIERTTASYSSPETWQGFKSLGFLGETEKRFVPEILSLDQSSHRADFDQLFHRIYREQCFPHPDNAKLFDITEFGLPEKNAASVVGENKEYPHYWESDCVYPREAPVLQTQLDIEAVPLLVPTLKTNAVLAPVKQLVPTLKSSVEVKDIELMVPALNTDVVLLPVEQSVPELNSTLIIEVTELAVPSLTSSLEIIPVPSAIPALETLVVLEPVEVEIPELQSALEIIEQPLGIPVLQSSVEFDQAKPQVFEKPVAKVAPKPIVVASRGGTGGYGGGYVGGGIVPTVVAPAVIAPRPIAVQPVVQSVVAQVPVVNTQPTIIIDKNAPLLERLLASLNNGSNVLIIDKIQLTVNEYNGNVETAISSSDVGTSSTVSGIDKTALIKELVRFDAQSSEPVPVLPAVQKAQVSAKTEQRSVKPETKVVTPRYMKAPELQTLLLVSSQAQPPVAKAIPKTVVISKPKTKVVKVPGLKTKIAVNTKPKSTPKKKTYKAVKKKAATPKKGSSSLFVYKPYKNGDKPSAKEKSVEQLLQEYADYEARRKAGRSSKKKVNTKKVEPVSKSDIAPKYKVGKIPSKATVTSKTQASKVIKSESKPKAEKQKLVKSASESKAQVAASAKSGKKVSAQKKVAKTDSKNSNEEKITEVVLSSKASKPDSEVNFTFEDAVPDYDDVKQVTAVATNPPSGLSTDAPIPYVIEENFINDQLDGDKSKAKKDEKKPIGLAGSVYLKKSLGSGNWGVGGSINRKLKKDDYWFARVGWSYSLEEDEDPFSYSWGIGYSDWHSGTFSAQLNNWGPIKMGEGLALDKAIASFGYSVKSEILKKYRLSLSGALNIPIDGNTSAAINTRWSPFENWYINASVSQPLEGDGDPKWSYGFGYSDWRPNKFNLQYSNYGPNDLFYHNYQTNGTWSLSYNYKF